MQINTYQLAATLRRYRDRTAQRQRNIYKIGQGDLFGVDTPDRVRKFFLRRGFADADIDRMIAGTAQGAGAMRPTVAASESFGLREPDALERVIGTSDLMGVSFLERGLAVSRTVARVWVDYAAGSPQGYGTGFMISPRLLMTNHHVLTDKATAQASKAEFNYQLGLDGNPTPTTLYGLRPADFFITDADLDYAVVAVDTSTGATRPLSDFGFNAMLQEEGKAIAAQWLNIIQHPEGGYKQLALRENQLVDVSDKFLTYQTDTAPGSSGSPVYNDRWEVVALHHSGVPARDGQGNILATDGSRWTNEMGEDKVKWVSNEGVRISQVIGGLRSKASTAGLAAYIDEMLSAASGPMASRETASMPQADSQPQMGASSSFAPNLRGGVATWTIPLTISIGLPGAMVTAGQATPGYGAPVDGSGSGTGAGDAASSGSSTGAAQGRATQGGASGDFETILGQAKASLGARPDVLSVKAGYVFKDGWITKQQAIVVKVRKRLAAGALRESNVAPLPTAIGGVPVEVINPTIDDLFQTQAPAAATELFRQATVQAEEILYHPPAGKKLTAVKAKMKLGASVSPDHGWPFLQDFLAGAKNTLVVGMYDFGAPHIRDAIVKMGKKAAFKKMTMAIQAGSDEGSGTKADDLPDDQMVAALKKALGAKFDSTWVKIGIKNGWVATSYHIKVAVRDSRAFWLSSGNWQSSNQPDADPLAEKPQKRSWLTKYNREWHVVVENTDLAKLFEAYIVNDFKENQKLAAQEIAMPDVIVPGAMLLPSPDERTATFKYFAPFTAERVFDVQPLLTPDNYKDALLKMVNSAKQELLIQNQTFNAATDKQEDLGGLLDAIIAKQNAGVDVRVIFRILDSSKARENLEALQERGFDMDRVKVQRNCHTKGVIVDGAQVMIGSQNLSQLGITLNRDASLLIQDKALTAYFTQIFEHDWANLAKQDIGNEAQAPELATGPATPAGMERISWKEYMEMA